jgi:RNA polymerase sigma factor (sigma-70 family)
MTPSFDDSLDPSRQLVKRLGEGDDSAATAVFEKYFKRMVRLAHRRQAPNLRARFDAEDIAQSALRTFFGRAREGQFEVTCADDLWSLLATITLRKLSFQTRKHRSKKRTVTREITPDSNGRADAIELTAPDAAALLVEQLDVLLKKLPQQYRKMVLLRVKGFSVPEVAEMVDCCERTVFRASERFAEVAREANTE